MAMERRRPWTRMLQLHGYQSQIGLTFGWKSRRSKPGPTQSPVLHWPNMPKGTEACACGGTGPSRWSPADGRLWGCSDVAIAARPALRTPPPDPKNEKRGEHAGGRAKLASAAAPGFQDLALLLHFSQCREALGEGGVDANRIVQVLLREAGLYGDAKTLGHLAGVHA